MEDAHPRSNNDLFAILARTLVASLSETAQVAEIFTAQSLSITHAPPLDEKAAKAIKRQADIFKIWQLDVCDASWASWGPPLSKVTAGTLVRLGRSVLAMTEILHRYPVQSTLRERKEALLGHMKVSIMSSLSLRSQGAPPLGHPTTKEQRENPRKVDIWTSARGRHSLQEAGPTDPSVRATPRFPASSVDVIDTNDQHSSSDSDDEDDFVDLSMDEIIEELEECISCLVDLGPTLTRSLTFDQHQTRNVVPNLTPALTEGHASLGASKGFQHAPISNQDLEDYWTLRIKDMPEPRLIRNREVGMNPVFVINHLQDVERRLAGVGTNAELASDQEITLVHWLTALSNPVEAAAGFTSRQRSSTHTHELYGEDQTATVPHLKTPYGYEERQFFQQMMFSSADSTHGRGPSHPQCSYGQKHIPVLGGQPVTSSMDLMMVPQALPLSHGASDVEQSPAHSAQHQRALNTTEQIESSAEELIRLRNLEDTVIANVQACAERVVMADEIVKLRKIVEGLGAQLLEVNKKFDETDRQLQRVSEELLDLRDQVARSSTPASHPSMSRSDSTMSASESSMSTPDLWQQDQQPSEEKRERPTGDEDQAKTEAEGKPQGMERRHSEVTIRDQLADEIDPDGTSLDSASPWGQWA